MLKSDQKERFAWGAHGVSRESLLRRSSLLFSSYSALFGQRYISPLYGSNGLAFCGAFRAGCILLYCLHSNGEGRIVEPC